MDEGIGGIYGFIYLGGRQSISLSLRTELGYQTSTVENIASTPHIIPSFSAYFPDTYRNEHKSNKSNVS